MTQLSNIRQSLKSSILHVWKWIAQGYLVYAHAHRSIINSCKTSNVIQVKSKNLIPEPRQEKFWSNNSEDSSLKRWSKSVGESIATQGVHTVKIINSDMVSSPFSSFPHFVTIWSILRIDMSFMCKLTSSNSGSQLSVFQLSKHISSHP
jgi:hypothetical protein